MKLQVIHYYREPLSEKIILRFSTGIFPQEAIGTTLLRCYRLAKRVAANPQRPNVVLLNKE